VFEQLAKAGRGKATALGYLGNVDSGESSEDASYGGRQLTTTVNTSGIQIY
jgi:hypothetical protein